MKGLIVFASLICCMLANPVKEGNIEQPADKVEEQAADKAEEQPAEKVEKDSAEKVSSRQDRQFGYSPYPMYDPAPFQGQYHFKAVPSHGIMPYQAEGFKMMPQAYVPHGYAPFQYGHYQQPQYQYVQHPYYTPSYIRAGYHEGDKDVGQNGFVCWNKGTYSICLG